MQGLKDFSLQLLIIIRKRPHIVAPLEIIPLSFPGIRFPFISLFYFYYIHWIYPFLLYVWSSKSLECDLVVAQKIPIHIQWSLLQSNILISNSGLIVKQTAAYNFLTTLKSQVPHLPWNPSVGYCLVCLLIYNAYVCNMVCLCRHYLTLHRQKEQWKFLSDDFRNYWTNKIQITAQVSAGFTETFKIKFWKQMQERWILKGGGKTLWWNKEWGNRIDWLDIWAPEIKRVIMRKMDKKVSGPQQAHLDYTSMWHNVFTKFCFPLCMKIIYTWMFNSLTRY